jgi:hypothetical protein
MTIANGAAERHPVIGEKRKKMATAVLPKRENVDIRSALRDLGGCLDFARRYVGWTIDQLAAETWIATPSRSPAGFAVRNGARSMWCSACGSCMARS